MTKVDDYATLYINHIIKTLSSRMFLLGFPTGMSKLSDDYVEVFYTG